MVSNLKKNQVLITLIHRAVRPEVLLIMRRVGTWEDDSQCQRPREHYQREV